MSIFATQRRSRSTVAPSIVALLCAWLAAVPAHAWVYPEHRDISLLAVGKLDPARRSDFDRLWQEARGSHEQRLCEQGADADQGLTPPCIDWAALAAIAGDHSCSSQDLSSVALRSDWILTVADVAAQLKIDLSRIDVLPPVDYTPGDKSLVVDIQRRMQTEGVRAARVNALRTADTRLQRADPEYATRAGANNAHFLLARPRTDITAQEYAELTLRHDSEISAVGVYGWYHLSALQKATRVAKDTLAPEERRNLVRAMLFDEAFALHFLQDVYASGHVAGTWGDTSQRKGTHDYYNAAGLEVFVWKGSSTSMVLMGDAHMRPQDAERAAVAVRASLEQVLDTAAGRSRTVNLPYAPTAPSESDAFDVCRNNTLQRRAEGLRAAPEAYQLAYEVLGPTPVPGLGPGLGAMPRFRSEVGWFAGLAGTIDGRYVNGGFTPSESGGLIGGVDLSGRIGLGLEGVIGDAGDGLVFLSLGLRGDSSSMHSVANEALAQQGGNLASAIPSRMGISTRLRMPFYLVPGDLLLLAPLHWIAPKRYEAMAVTAGNGGLIPWQAGWATSIGRFQWVLGRELGVTFYGHIGDDRVLAPGVTPGAPARVVDFQSTMFDLPILEYRPYRAFSSDQSSALLFQLFAAADIPHGERVVSPAGAPDVGLDTVWSVGLRLLFDWRYYP